MSRQAGRAAGLITLQAGLSNPRGEQRDAVGTPFSTAAIMTALTKSTRIGVNGLLRVLLGPIDDRRMMPLVLAISVLLLPVLGLAQGSLGDWAVNNPYQYTLEPHPSARLTSDSKNNIKAVLTLFVPCGDGPGIAPESDAVEMRLTFWIGNSVRHEWSPDGPTRKIWFRFDGEPTEVHERYIYAGHIIPANGTDDLLNRMIQHQRLKVRREQDSVAYTFNLSDTSKAVAHARSLCG